MFRRWIPKIIKGTSATWSRRKNSKNQNTVGDMVSAKNWGRFWCRQYRLWQPCRFETTQCNSLSNSSKTRRYVFTPMLSGLRWPGQTVMGSWPPALNLALERERTKEEKVREVLHLFRCYTHTHTRPEPGQPWKARGRKKRTHDGQTAKKQRRGGEGNRRTSGTNLHGETDLTKTAHTPKPHDTLRRGTRGKLGTKWGTS